MSETAVDFFNHGCFVINNEINTHRNSYLSCCIANLARLSRVRFYILPEGSLHIGKYIVQ